MVLQHEILSIYFREGKIEAKKRGKKNRERKERKKKKSPFLSQATLKTQELSRNRLFIISLPGLLV